MSSLIEICNSALTLCGVDSPILSLDDDKKTARLCKINITLVRDECLEDHYWNFAMKRVTLAQLAEKPLYGFSFQYQLPADVIRVKSLNADTQLVYKIEGDFLLTNQATAEILYISKSTDVSKYSPSFVEAFAHKLASKICYALVQSVSLMDRLEKRALDKLKNARSIDGLADHMDDFVDDTFNDARLGTHGFLDRGIDVEV